MKVIPETGREQ